MATKDLYSILGVSKNASDDDLKKAYRKLAMQHHPDRNPGDKKAEQTFKEVNAAYDTLKDPQKRAAYDRYGDAAFQQGGPGGASSGGGNPFGGGFGGFSGGFNFEDLEDLMNELHGQMGGGMGSRRARQSSHRGADLRYDVEVTLEQAYKGAEIPINLTANITCETCKGSGAKAGTQPKTCGTCKGSGSVNLQLGPLHIARPCPDCGGRGTIIPEPCPKCRGTGHTRHTQTVTITIPQGVEHGHRLLFAGKGEAGQRGAPAGDLYVFVGIRRHPLFQRDGADLHLEVPLPFTEALLGTTVTLPLPDGKTTELKVPEGTQPGAQIRLRGQGMPVFGHPRRQGDIVAHIAVENPPRLSKKQRELLEDLQADIGLTRAAEAFRSAVNKLTK